MSSRAKSPVRRVDRPNFPTTTPVTDFWSDMDAAREYADGKRMIDAALDAGSVDLFIWSGLESVSTLSKGELTEVKHFDSKVCVTNFLEAAEGCPG